MKTVVITGSTRGIGYGLADVFLLLGCNVVISGRTDLKADRAVNTLSEKHASDRVVGRVCEVTDPEQLQALWDETLTRFGAIDIWINNAGISHLREDFWDLSPQQIVAVVNTNLVGTMVGSRVALRGFLQQGFGSLYNMEGLGSDGRKLKGLTLYGTSKYAVRYLTEALAEETRETGVLVCSISPGMVVTDLLMEEFRERPEELERAQRILNILADRVETVAPYIALEVLSNTRTGRRIRWLTTGRIIGRFLAAPFRHRNVI